MEKRPLAIILILAMAVTLLSGCGNAATETTPAPAETPTAQETGRAAANEINIGIAQDFDSLDPDYMTAAGTKEILFNVFEGLVKPNAAGEIVPAVASSVEKTGIKEVWNMIEDYIRFTRANGYFDYKRTQQAKYWMYETINASLLNSFYQSPDLEPLIEQYEQRVLNNEISSFIAAGELLKRYAEYKNK